MTAATMTLNPLASATKELLPIRPPKEQDPFADFDLQETMAKTWAYLGKAGRAGGTALKWSAETIAAMARRIYQWIRSFLCRMGLMMGRKVDLTANPSDDQLQGKAPLRAETGPATAAEIKEALHDREAVPVEAATAGAALNQAASKLSEHVEATLPNSAELLAKEPAHEHFAHAVDDLCKILHLNQGELGIKRGELDQMVSELATRENTTKESILEMLKSPAMQKMLDKEGLVQSKADAVKFLESQADMSFTAMKSLVDAAETWGVEKSWAAERVLKSVAEYQLQESQFPQLAELRTMVDAVSKATDGNKDAHEVYSVKQKAAPSAADLNDIASSPFARLARAHQMDIEDAKFTNDAKHAPKE